MPTKFAGGTLRLSVGTCTTEEQIDEASQIITEGANCQFVDTSSLDDDTTSMDVCLDC